MENERGETSEWEDERDESGFSEKEMDLDVEIRAGEWQNLRRFRSYQRRSRQWKIIATYQAISNRLRQLEQLFYELVRNHPTKSEKLLWEIKKLRLIQEILLQCLVWYQSKRDQQQLEKDMVPQEVWDLIK
ncbi:MAG: hypothetical protein HY429_03210 [Candidatus Levybacteria bacterium]|nr:hypothetical protein [Candidatus Levybacteria bacterium]